MDNVHQFHKPTPQEVAMDLFKANEEKLNNCPGPHMFTDMKGDKTIYTCSKCQGVVSAVAAYWYGVGHEHGRTGR